MNLATISHVTFLLFCLGVQIHYWTVCYGNFKACHATTGRAVLITHLIQRSMIVSVIVPFIYGMNICEYLSEPNKEKCDFSTFNDLNLVDKIPS